MEYILTFIVGWVVSFFAAIPLGPVNLAVISRCLEKKRPEAYRIAFGSSVAEFGFALVATVGASQLNDWLLTFKPLFLWIQIVGAVILMGLGFSALITKRSKKSRLLEVMSKKSGFWFGFSLNAINPTLLLFWLGISAYLLLHRWIGSSSLSMAVFSIGVGVGTFSLQAVLMQVTAHYGEKMTVSFRKKVNFSIAILFVALGCVAIGQAFWQYI